MATATATAGGGSNNNRAMLNAKERGAEVIGMDGNNKDSGTDAGSLLTAVVVDRGGNGMEPMELISIGEGCGKDAIAAAAINCCCSQQ